MAPRRRPPHVRDRHHRPGQRRALRLGGPPRGARSRGSMGHRSVRRSVVLALAGSVVAMTTVADALALASRGFSVFPCERLGKRPANGVAWAKAATTDPRQ